MPCPRCGEDDLHIIRRNGAENGALVSFIDELTQCATCGEEFYTYEQSMANSRAYAAAIRAADQFPSPDAIYQIRCSLDMTQEQFERALGVGKKTVVRWERGTVAPSRAAGGLLWFAARYPNEFLEYARTLNPDMVQADEQVIAEIRTAPGRDSPPVVLRPSKGRRTDFTAEGEEFKTSGASSPERRLV